MNLKSVMARAKSVRKEFEDGPSHKAASHQDVLELARVVEQLCRLMDPVPAAALADELKVCLGIVSRQFRVSALAITSRARPETVSRARWVVLWLLTHYYGLGSRHAGRMLGLDHSAVSYAARQVELLRAAPEFRRKIEACEAEMTAHLEGV